MYLASERNLKKIMKVKIITVGHGKYYYFIQNVEGTFPSLRLHTASLLTPENVQLCKV